MKIHYCFLIPFSIALTGCFRPDLEFKTEPLTGQEYCVINNTLLPLKNSDHGTLILKRSREETAVQNQAIKAILTVAHHDKRDYSVNPHETLSLSIDGTRYALDVLHSLKDPREEIGSYSTHMPSGRSINLGAVKEVTRRTISFFLSDDSLSKISGAKEVYFEINAPSLKESPSLQEYPIILELSPENSALIQEFKAKCVNNFINQSGVEK